MELIVLSPNKQLFAGKANLLQLPGVDGSFEIRPQHAALISALKAGQVQIATEDGEKLSFAIQSGFVEVANDKVSLLLQEALAK